MWFPARVRVMVQGKWNAFRHGSSYGVRWRWIVTNGALTAHNNYGTTVYTTKRDAAAHADRINAGGGRAGRTFPCDTMHVADIAKYKPTA